MLQSVNERKRTMTSPERAGHGAGGSHDDRKAVVIFIDGKRYESRERELTGDQIRHLAIPPIGQDRDLWLEGPGGLDQLIGDHEEVRLHEGMRFFTVPKVINPGSA
jgi:Multiubiquitin